MLPELLQPAGTPCFLLAGHGVTPDPLHDDLDPNIGHGRRRKVFRSAPRILNVSLALDDEQAEAYDAWFESVLMVGSAQFTAEVAQLGIGSRYWAAEWVAPPVWGAKVKGRWQVTGQLLLTGEGSDEPPQGTTLVDEYVTALGGSARLTSGVSLVDEYIVALTANLPLSDEYAIELLAGTDVTNNRELRVGGGIELRADGGFELRN